MIILHAVYNEGLVPNARKNHLWFRGMPGVAERSLFEEMKMKAACVVNGHLL